MPGYVTERISLAFSIFICGQAGSDTTGDDSSNAVDQKK